MNKLKNIKLDQKTWKAIAYVSGVFSFIISVLLIVTYLQLNKVDPINTELINSLVERLSENPNDELLRNEIRTLDLLVRKAYFTNQWQIRTGAYLLLIGVSILVIALQFLKSEKGIKPEIDTKEKETYTLTQMNSRKWIAIGGTVLVFTSLFFAFLMNNDLTEKFENASTPQELIVESEKVQIADPIVEEKVIDQSLIEEKASVEDEVIAEVKKEEVTKPKAVASSGNKNYSSFRGYNGNGIAYNTNTPVSWNGTTGENILWKVPVALPGFNSPIIWGDKLFISGANDTKKEVYCYNRNTGELIWTREVKDIPNTHSSPDVTPDTGHAAPTLTTDGETVIAIFSNGDIIAFDINGNKVWAKNLGLPENHYGHSSSLLIYKDKVIIQFDDRKTAKLLALSTKTGEVKWSTPRAVKISWASPVLIDNGSKKEIVIAADPIVASYDPDTGKENWKFDCITGEVGPSVAYTQGIVFAVNEYSILTAIQTGDNPQILWENDEYLSDVPSPVAIDNYLFIATSWGALICYEAKTGAMFWEAEFENGIYSSPIIADGKIYLVDREGITHITEVSNEYKPIGEFPLGEKSDCTPAFADGRIYIRGDVNLYCIGK